MTPSTYQSSVLRTMADAPELNQRQARLVNWSLGLAGEAGEFVDQVKKVVFHGHEIRNGDMIKELGDVLWYVAALAHDLGYSIDEVMAMNVAKLRARYPDGFDQERSRNRP